MSNSKKYNTFWNTLLPLKRGQRVKIVRRAGKKTGSTFISQMEYSLDFVGETAKIEKIERTYFLPFYPITYLVELEKASYQLKHEKHIRTRLWCSPEELEVIDEEF